jgi:hypothetical protein
VKPGVSVWRVPPFMSAMLWSARWCLTILRTDTAFSSFAEPP